MTTYHRADTQSQWFQDNFPGADLNLNADTSVVVLHTTEGTTWPTYLGGATAPNYTAKADFEQERLNWRAHFPDEKSSRALVNLPGGVETNTLNANQVELVGTCDPKHRLSWNGLTAGVDYIYWPDAPDWALRSLARFLAYHHRKHGTVMKSLAFQAYPGSFGARGATNTVRLSGDQWRKFVGVCGHQHVPENVHGDPGNIDITKLIAFAERDLLHPKLRVVTANLHHGNRHLPEALHTLLEQDADIIFIQEAYVHYKLINRILGNTHKFFGARSGSGGERENQIWVRRGLKFKIHDHGEFKATIDLGVPVAPDRWVQWVQVEHRGTRGPVRRYCLVGWHGNAAIQDQRTGAILKLARVRQYAKEMKLLETFLKSQRICGFKPIVGADTNYKSRFFTTLRQMWVLAPERVYRRSRLKTIAHGVDKIAYPRSLEIVDTFTVQAAGCDHKWLVVDLEHK